MKSIDFNEEYCTRCCAAFVLGQADSGKPGQKGARGKAEQNNRNASQHRLPDWPLAEARSVMNERSDLSPHQFVGLVHARPRQSSLRSDRRAPVVLQSSPQSSSMKALSLSGEATPLAPKPARSACFWISRTRSSSPAVEWVQERWVGCGRSFSIRGTIARPEVRGNARGSSGCGMVGGLFLKLHKGRGAVIRRALHQRQRSAVTRLMHLQHGRKQIDR